MMKINLLINSLDGGGAERVVCNLSNYLVHKGHEVTIISLYNTNPAYYISPLVNRICLTEKNELSNKYYNYLLWIRRLKKYIVSPSAEGVDCYIGMLEFPIALLCILKKYIKCSVIVSERNNPSSYSKTVQNLLKHFFSKADGAVFQTTQALEYYNICNIKRTTVIHNAIDSKFCEKSMSYSSYERKNKIVAVGRLEKQKNYPLLIEAFSIFVKNHKDYQLIIYGIGSEEEKLRDLVAKLNMKDNIHFAGFVKNIHELIVDAAAFVLSSDYEGMPNALLEAMAIGLPCISTDCPVGGPREIIDDNINGILVPCNDVHALVQAMDKVVDNLELSTSLSTNAKRVSNRFSEDVIYEKWTDFISEVVFDGEN